jgi:prephenate dehydrogenase
VTLRSVVVVGTGLIGTSVALALRARDVRVLLADRDAESLRLAVSLGAGEPIPVPGSSSGLSVGSSPSVGSSSAGPSAGPSAVADLAVLAVPPSAVAPTLAAAQDQALARVYTDVASVKQAPSVAAAALGCDLTSFVPGHPLAGRERSGPAAARSDLFLGRAWALCPAPVTEPSAIAAVSELIALCGANEVITDPESHDRWVALVSHAPQVVSAALAARLEAASPDALTLAGQGLRDTTRIAAGDPGLWLQILGANAGPVAEILAEVAADLSEASHALTSLAASDPAPAAPSPQALTSSASSASQQSESAPSESALSEPAPSPHAHAAPGSSPASGRDIADKTLNDLLERGRAGVARIPGKHGEVARQFALVQVVIRDQPGELARLFNAAGKAGVNIEDIRIEHSPGLPVGAAELSVRPGDVAALLTAMEAGGWPAHGRIARDPS